MRALVYLSLTILLLTMPQHQAKAEQPVVAPDWTLMQPDGSSLRLSEAVRESTTILFFWATWCPYCKALMPHLQSIELEYGDAVQILAININDKGDPVAFVEKAGYDFTVLLDGDQVAKDYGIHGTPGVLIVNADREVLFDLRTLPRREVPLKQRKGHAGKAAYRAPYWSAAIRQALDRSGEPRPQE